MPPRKKTDATETAPVRAAIVPRNAGQWRDLMAQLETEMWRKIRVHVQVRGMLLAGKPKNLKVAEAMLKSRGLEDQIDVVPIDDPEARARAAADVIDEGLCEFHRRPDAAGIWFPTNNIKAMLKENWSVLGFRNEVRGSRGALAEGMFVYSVVPTVTNPEELDWIYLGDKPTGEHKAVAHTIGPMGPRSSVKRHEYVDSVDFWFEIKISKSVEEKVPDNAIAKTLIHAQEHGMGACRSQGFGKFNIIEVFDVGVADDDKQRAA